MIVMKFGGTSVADAEAIKRTIGIIRSRLDKKPIVVVSALAKVTDMLYSISYAAENRDLQEATTLIEKLRLRFLSWSTSSLARKYPSQQSGRL